MKNLKRVLSLALATVRVIGMMVVGANAAFNDQADIQYTEAVDTLVALGVIDGMGGNTFNPDGTLTRAQAAKMVAYVKAGANENTIGYYDGTTKFTDVGTNHAWASGSINYCVANGIIAGMTATTYQPDATLTGAQLSKMLLVALGYVANTTNANEALTGAAWQVNAIRMAQEQGLYKGMASSFSATRAVTREEACQMIYNALTHETLRVMMTVDGAPVYQSSGKDLIEVAFDTTGTDSTDDLGRPATLYTVNDEDVKVVKTADVSYTDTVTTGDIYKDLNLSKDIAEDDVVASQNGDSVTAKAIAKNGKDEFGGKGVLTEVFYDKDADTEKGEAIVTITQVVTYVGQVTDVTEADEAEDIDASIDFTAITGSFSGSFETTGYDVDDFILFTYSESADKVISVNTPETVTGTLTSTTGTTSLVVGGTTYKYAKTSDNNGIALKDDVILYMDAYGYVLYADVYEASGESNYAYVLDTGEGGIYDGEYYAKLLLTDGTVESVQTDKDYSAAGENLVNNIVTYKTNSKGLTVLTDKSAEMDPSQNVKLTKGVAKFYVNAEESNVTAGKSYYANNKTIFLVETEDANGDPVYNTYTGIANVPSMTATKKASVAILCDEDDTDLALVVYMKGITKTGDTNKDVVYVVGDKNVQKTETADSEYYEYNAVVNGEITTIKSKDKITENKLYGTVTYDDFGVATLADEIENSGEGTTRASNGLVGLGDGMYTYADDVNVFYVSTKGVISASTISGVKTDDNDTVLFSLDADDEIVTNIFVQQVAND